VTYSDKRASLPKCGVKKMFNDAGPMSAATFVYIGT
jgi:hypothetical protein